MEIDIAKRFHEAAVIIHETKTDTIDAFIITPDFIQKNRQSGELINSKGYL